MLREAGVPEWVVRHARCVEGQARAMAEAAETRGHRLDADLVAVGGVLHDVGRAQTQDVRHAGLGAQWLRARHLDEALALVVERHTGGGIDADEARALGLPVKDYTPRTLEERIVAHADNVYSGDKRLTPELLKEKYEAKGLPRAWQKIAALDAELTAILGTPPFDIPPRFVD